uniref:Metalloendopeptidase n=1 Tax=Platymeris rhadamanthus TaxID=1134088 RepID=A0A6B9L8W8_PLARH|nr:venom M12A protease 2 [Platymeris rhadamanthus]
MIFLILLAVVSITLGAPTSSTLKVECTSKVCEVVGDFEVSSDLLREEDILDGVTSRNALINSKKLWKKGIVPYVFHKKIEPKNRAKIENAMRLIEAQTCVKFVPWDQSMGENYLMVLANAGCFATVGYSRLNQRYLNLNQRGCMGKLGTMQHELLHVLGLEHEQSRPDRDQYVDIIKENILDGMEKNFKLVSQREYSTLDIPYDYNSVMHYSAYSFSKNRKATVLPKDKSIDPDILGQRNGASKSDIKKINIMYKCKM